MPGPRNVVASFRRALSSTTSFSADRRSLALFVAVLACAVTIPAVVLADDSGSADPPQDVLGPPLRASHQPAGVRPHGRDEGSFQLDEREGRSAPRGDELVGRRTATSRTFEAGNGRFVTRVYGSPVNFRDDQGDWRAIDNDLVPSDKAGYAFTNAANRYRVQLPDSLDQPVRFNADGDWATLRLSGAKGSASRSGSTATYDGALDGVDVSYSATSDGIKEKLVLHDGAPASYGYDLDLSDGLDARASGDGGVDIVDGDGHVRFSIPAPFAVDRGGAQISSGDAISLRPVHTGDGLRLELSIDPRWLHSAERRFPVTIDPGVRITDNGDCYMVNGTSANTNFCQLPTLKVGFDGTKIYRSVLRYDVQSAIPSGSTVQGAHLQLHLNATNNSTQTPIGAYRLTHSWVEGTGGVTWNKYDGVNAWTAAGGDFNSSAEYICTDPVQAIGSWDGWGLSDLTQKWLDGALANNGVLLKATNEATNNVVTFDSTEGPNPANNGYLQVDWQPEDLGDQELRGRPLPFSSSFRLIQAPPQLRQSDR